MPGDENVAGLPCLSATPAPFVSYQRRQQHLPSDALAHARRSEFLHAAQPQTVRRH